MIHREPSGLASSSNSARHAVQKHTAIGIGEWLYIGQVFCSGLVACGRWKDDPGEIKIMNMTSTE